MKRLLSCFLLLCINTAFSSYTPKEGRDRLQSAHDAMQLIHGSFKEEYPEQLMAAMYIPANAKVLELGANVGRNSCAIGFFLEDSKNLVCVESCKESALLLQENRDFNGLQFHIEASALSKTPLIQSGWSTIPGSLEIPGYTRVDIISFDDLQEKYQIEFDTLVVDCEGALYQILIDDVNVLRNINLIVIENDFTDANQMKYVQLLFNAYGLKLVYNQKFTDWWLPCGANFYQVWSK